MLESPATVGGFCRCRRRPACVQEKLEVVAPEEVHNPEISVRRLVVAPPPELPPELVPEFVPDPPPFDVVPPDEVPDEVLDGVQPKLTTAIKERRPINRLRGETAKALLAFDDLCDM